MLTDAEESYHADAALVVPGKETDVAALGTGERGVAFPKAFSNADLTTTQANDPDCLRCMQRVNKPRTQWPSHLAAAHLQCLYVAEVLCVQISSAWDPARTTRQPDGVPDAGAFDPSLVVPALCYLRTLGSEHARASPQVLRGTFRAG